MFVAVCGFAVSANAEISETISNQAYTALKYFLIVSGKSEPYADCVVFALKLDGATKDFKEGNVFTDLQRLTEHLKDKVDAVDLVCSNQIVSIVIAVLLILLILSLLGCLIRCICCK